LLLLVKSPLFELNINCFQLLVQVCIVHLAYAGRAAEVILEDVTSLMRKLQHFFAKVGAGNVHHKDLPSLSCCSLGGPRLQNPTQVPQNIVVPIRAFLSELKRHIAAQRLH